jgi:hypothetical protein
MATIGSLSVAFTANLSDLESGIEKVLDLFDDLTEAVEDISEKLDSVAEKTITVKTKADTDEIKKASKDVDDLKSNAESKNAKVKVSADTEDLIKSLESSSAIGDQLSLAFREEAKGMSDGFAAFGAKAATAFKTVGSAATGLGNLLDGTRLSVDGLVSSMARLSAASASVRELTNSLADEAGVFLQYVGGTGTVLAAFAGSVASSAAVIAAFGAAVAAAVVRTVVFRGVLALVRVAASGLSEESRAFVTEWAAVAAGIVSSAAAAGAAAATFSILSGSITSASASASLLARAMEGISSVAKQAASSIASRMGQIVTLFSLATVASGKYASALDSIGAKAESIRNMAERFGATTGEMEVLTFAAESAGVSMSQLAKASQSFYTNVSKVKIGQLNVDSVQEAKFAFDRLGVSIDELRNKNPQEVFGLVSEELLAVKDPADRAAIAFDLFGKQAVNVLPALRGLKEAAADAARLGTVTKDIDFKMFEGVDASFDRLKQASGNLSQTMMVAFAPLQAGINNFLADLQGGLAAALGPVRTLMAAATVPIQVFLEVVGRVMNILLRMIGVAGTFATALLQATAIAPAWTALGSVIKEALSYIEQGVNFAQNIASAFSSQLNPTIDESASMFDRLAFAVKTFTAVIISAGVGSAVMQAFGVQAGAALAKFAAGLLKLNFATIFGGILKLVRMLTFDIVAASSRWVASMILMGTSTIAGLLAPFMTSVATIITGNSAIAVASAAAGYAMAAAWVIGTLGLAAIAVAIIAVIQNFDNLYAYFADFGNNAARLFTLEGLGEAATAVVDAIKGAFKSLAGWVSGFFGGIIGGIIKAINGIKTPEKISAASASVGDIVKSRQDQQMATYQTEASAAGFTGKTPELPTEDYDALSASVSRARGDMIGLSLNAAKFGEAGNKAFMAARADFDQLQQQLADNTLELRIVTDEDGVKRQETALEAFERRSKEIRGRLEENLNLADTISPEQFQQSAQDMRKAVEDAFAQTRNVMRGSDLGSDLNTDRFFPASSEIKKAASDFAMAYQDELIRIEEALQSGEFGQGQSAMRAAQQAREDAKSKFDKNMGKVNADVSFATEIRKALEDAFLTPVQKYEKKLKEIADNKSLTAQEKSLATIVEQQQMVEGTFGKSAGQSLREKEGMFAQATAVDQYGRTAFMSAEGSQAAGEARASAERTKLDIERRKAAGLDASPAQQLKAGVDNINDVFGVAGKSLAEIQKELGPEKFAEYQEAIKKNSDAVKANLGVEKSGAEKLAESRAKLEKAFNDKVISEEEMNKAVKEQKDALLSSLGITKSPAKEFEDAVAKIKENAAELTPEELQKGLKEAKDKLLQSLGIDKSPAAAAEESLNKLREAFNKGQISAEEFAKGSQKAKDALLQSLGIPLDPVTQLSERLTNLQDAFDKGLISQEEFTRGQDEARRSMLPGGEEESPVKKFERDLDAVNRAVEGGLISDEDGAQRKKVLQAQLQEDLKPALERVAPDRRAVESSDVRSKEGVDTFFRILRGNDNPSLKAQLEIARNTRQLAEAAANADAAPVIAQLSAT